ncbi:9561_t:CDS:2, partial [Acaulospora morrowiae]
IKFIGNFIQFLASNSPPHSLVQISKLKHPKNMNQLILLVFITMLAFSTIDTAPLLAKRDESYKGRATFYDPGLGSCGITNSPQDFIVALNIPQYTGNDVCNKVVLITGPKGSVKCTVTDKCPGCGFGCLDLSPAAFNQIGDQSAGVVDITWSYVDGNDKPQQPPESTKGQPTT